MKLKIKNAQLQKAIEFVNSLTLDTARENIARIRMYDLLVRKFDEFQADRQAVLKSFANKGEDGEPIINDNKFDIPDDKMDDLKTAITELLNEQSVIDYTEYESQIGTFKTALENYDKPLDGTQARELVTIIDAIEQSEKEGK